MFKIKSTHSTLIIVKKFDYYRLELQFSIIFFIIISSHDLFSSLDQNDTPTLAPTTSLQLLQQLQASSSAATPVASNTGAASALSSVQHQLLLQQHLGLSAATASQAAAAPAVPSSPEISQANLQGLATLASLGNTTGEYGQCFQFPHFSILFYYSFSFIQSQ